MKKRPPKAPGKKKGAAAKRPPPRPAPRTAGKKPPRAQAQRRDTVKELPFALRRDTLEEVPLALRHDTPEDRPAVARDALAPRPGSLIDRLSQPDAQRRSGPVGVTALARLAQLETLEEAFEAWDELRAEHALAQARSAEERERLEREGSFLLGAVRAAGDLPSASPAPGGSALAPSGRLGQLVAEAEEKLRKARQALEEEQGELEAAYRLVFAKVKAEIRARVERYAGRTAVPLKLMLRPVGGSRTILHLGRVAPDEALLLLWSFQQSIPTRYGFLFDDSTEDFTQEPPPLYADEGLSQAELRPDAVQLRALVERRSGDALPIKGFLPLLVPRPDGGRDFFRLLQRAAVMEVELQEGPRFRNVLTREEGERLAGHLLRLKLQGRVGLEIEAG